MSGGITIQLPDNFTAGEVNVVLREIARLQSEGLLTATGASFIPTPVRIRQWLEEDDRLYWAIAKLRGRESGSTTADEAEARELIHVLFGDA